MRTITNITPLYMQQNEIYIARSRSIHSMECSKNSTICKCEMSTKHGRLFFVSLRVEMHWWIRFSSYRPKHSICDHFNSASFAHSIQFNSIRRVHMLIIHSHPMFRLSILVFLGSRGTRTLFSSFDCIALYICWMKRMHDRAANRK